MSRSAPATMFLRQRMRAALLALVLLAFGAQQWAASTHWHGLPESSAQLASTPDAPGASHLDCLWCQLSSHAGAIAPPPASPALLLAGAVAHGAVTVHRQADFIPPPAFSWHSRGPPAA